MAGVALYLWLGAPWLALIPLLLVPDLSMIGYVHSPKIGALTYNLAHNWATGLIVLGIGLWLPSVPLAVAGAVLIAHVGMDRVLGYGLKLQSAFHRGSAAPPRGRDLRSPTGCPPRSSPATWPSADTFVHAVRAGIVHVNGETAGAEPHLPFGGMKASSSWSREQGHEAEGFYTQTKTVYLDGLPGAGLFDID